MRFLVAALGIYGLYRLIWREADHPRALLTDMRSRGARAGEEKPSEVTYEVVAHDGGWAYKVKDVYSETFATREEATEAATQAAAAHRRAGSDAFIEYQDRQGRWHEEIDPGDDRPDTRVATGPAT